MAWSTLTTRSAGDAILASDQNITADNFAELAPLFTEWTSWTPTLTQGVAVTLTNTRSRYVQVGKLVIASATVTATSSGTLNGTIVLGFGSGATALPTALSADTIFGSFTAFDSGNTNYTGFTRGSSTTAVQFVRSGNGNPFGNGDMQLTNTDILRAFFIYEAA